MLVHLVRGEFTVDRDAIDYEGLTQDGKTYTYFAVFPAILRLLAMPFADIAHAELARLSCWWPWSSSSAANLSPIPASRNAGVWALLPR